MKKIISYILMVIFSLTLLCSCGNTEEIDKNPIIIKKLDMTKFPKARLQDDGKIKLASMVYGENLYDVDFSNDLYLLNNIDFSTNTKFPSNDKMPKGFDVNKLVDWGKEARLNSDILAKHGFTGKGVSVAYLDTGINPINDDFEGVNIIPDNTSKLSDTNHFHSYSVASILCGNNLGLIPDADNIYFYGGGGRDGYEMARVIRKIIEFNNTLPEENKIRFFGMSNNVTGPTKEQGRDDFINALIEMEHSGIFVFLCESPIALVEAGIPNFSDRNNPNNYTLVTWL